MFLILAEKPQQGEKFILEGGILEREDVNRVSLLKYTVIWDPLRESLAPGWQTATETPVCMNFGNIQNYSVFILLLTSTKGLAVYLAGGGEHLFRT